MKRYLVWVLLGAFLAAYLLYSSEKEFNTISSLTYFPRDPSLHFLTAMTSLRESAADQDKKGYHLHWMTSSETDQPVYLRQDVSLLFQNGKLIQVHNLWKQRVKDLSFSKTLQLNHDSYLEALTDHYAEHHPKGSEVTSQDVMSWDHLFVMTKGQKTPQSFRYPDTNKEVKLRDHLTSDLSNKQNQLLKQAESQFHLNLTNYDAFPLSHITTYQTNSLPGLDELTSHRVISQLWEGLYKNYILGIHVNGSDIESPVGSDMPLILYKKSGDQLLVLIHSKSGQLVILKQTI